MGNTEDGVPPVASLYDAQRYVERRLEQKWLPKFVADADFVARQSLDIRLGHVVDDVIAARRRRNVQALERVSRSGNPKSTFSIGVAGSKTSVVRSSEVRAISELNEEVSELKIALSEKSSSLLSVDDAVFPAVNTSTTASTFDGR